MNHSSEHPISSERITVSPENIDVASSVPVFLQAVGVKRIILNGVGKPGSGMAWGAEQPKGIEGTIWINKDTSDVGRLAVLIHEFLHFLGYNEALTRQDELKLLAALNIRLPEGEDIRGEESE